MARKNTVYFSFGGIDTRDYGILVDTADTLVKPTRDIERLVVPGRSGGLTVDNGRWNDITVTYHCHVKKRIDDNFNRFLAALHALGGERRLIDDRLEQYYTGTYNGKQSPGCYRMAILDTSVQAEEVYAGYSGDFDITFTCKPQMWLNVGNVGIEVTSSTGNVNIDNPTSFQSKPLLQLYGKGTGETDATMAQFTIYGDGSTQTTTIGVNKNSPYGYLYVDCDIEDAYNGAANCNRYIKVMNDRPFPVCGSRFAAGIDTSKGATKMVIYPRWWTV